MLSYEIVISDTSALIALERIDSLDLLERVFKTVIITEKVAAEFGIPLPKWLEVRPVSLPAVREAEKMMLDPGETSAIALALELGDCLLVLDDKAARKKAERRGMRTTGLLGVLLRAKNAGVIHSVADYIERLKEADFRVSDVLATKILHLAGEKT